MVDWGDHPYDLTWQFNGDVLPVNTQKIGNELIVKNVQAHNTGTYTCVVSDRRNSYRKSTSLTVFGNC